jgi:hypothetical protein
VSLSKSQKQTVDASDISTPVLDARNAQPCGAGDRPSFELVMFFERDADAVASTPTTSTGSVSATPTPTPTASATPDGGTTASSTTTTQPEEGAAP